MLKPTALPSLPGVVVSVFVLHSSVGFSLHTKCCRVLYNCSNIVGRGRGKLNHSFRMKHLGCPVLFGDKWILNKWIRWESQMFTRKCFLPKGSNYPSNLKIVEASLWQIELIYFIRWNWNSFVLRVDHPDLLPCELHDPGDGQGLVQAQEVALCCSPLQALSHMLSLKINKTKSLIGPLSKSWFEYLFD